VGWPGGERQWRRSPPKPARSRRAANSHRSALLQGPVQAAVHHSPGGGVGEDQRSGCAEAGVAKRRGATRAEIILQVGSCFLTQVGTGGACIKPDHLPIPDPDHGHDPIGPHSRPPSDSTARCLARQLMATNAGTDRRWRQAVRCFAARRCQVRIGPVLSSRTRATARIWESRGASGPSLPTRVFKPILEARCRTPTEQPNRGLDAPRPDEARLDRGKDRRSRKSVAWAASALSDFLFQPARHRAVGCRPHSAATEVAIGVSVKRAR